MKEEKAGNKEWVHLLFNYLRQKIITKFNSYKANPKLILIELYELYQTIWHKILNLIDTPPKQKRNEDNRDYFDRIDPKYGLRYYKFLMSKRLLIDIPAADAYIDKFDLTESEKNEFKEFFRMTRQVDSNTEENYSRYYLRNKILKGQQNLRE